MKLYVTLTILFWIGIAQANHFEDVMDLEIGDEASVFSIIHTALDQADYDKAYAYIGFYSQFPNEFKNREIEFNDFINEWKNDSEIPNFVAKEIAFHFAISRANINSGNKASLEAYFPGVMEWYNWRISNPTQGLDSGQFSYSNDLPDVEKETFQTSVSINTEEANPDDLWFDEQLGRLQRLIDHLEFSAQQQEDYLEILELGSALTQSLINKQYQDNVTKGWNQTTWNSQSRRLASEIYNAAYTIQDLRSNSNAFSNIVSEFSDLVDETWGTNNFLTPYRNLLLTEASASLYAYLWPEENFETKTSSTALQLVNNHLYWSNSFQSVVISYMAEISDYLVDIKDLPHRLLALQMLTNSRLNYESLRPTEPANYHQVGGISTTPGWIEKLENLSEVFALNYHNELACPAIQTNGFDRTYSSESNTFIKNEITSMVPVRYLPDPNTGDMSESSLYHNKFSSCETLVSFYGHLMEILLSDIERSKAKLNSNSDDCVSRWVDNLSSGSVRQNSSSDACDLYSLGTLVSNESQASAIYDSSELKEKLYFALNNNNPSVPETIDQAWQNSIGGFGEQFLCLQWRDYTVGKIAPEATEYGFIQERFDYLVNYLFLVAMVHNDQVLERGFARDINLTIDKVQISSNQCKIPLAIFHPIPGMDPIVDDKAMYRNALTKILNMSSGVASIRPLPLP